MAIVVDDGDTPAYPDYLSFTSSGNSTIKLTNFGGNAPVIYYSFDRENWTLWDYSAISLTDGQIVYMYGDNGGDGGRFSLSNNTRSTFTMTGSITANGNVMSLLGEDFENYTAVGEYCFFGLFYNCSVLGSAPLFPATILADRCYYEAFQASGITESPYLPADPNKYRCYYIMFKDCNSLSKITFGGDLWDTTNANGWVSGVPATGTFVCKQSLTIPVGANGIPSGWTREDL